MGIPNSHILLTQGHFLLVLVMILLEDDLDWQGAKKVSFTECRSGKPQLAPKPFLISRIDYNPYVI